MKRALVAILAASAASACHDEPPRAPPPPSAAGKVSRAMLGEAMIAAVANAREAQRLAREARAAADDGDPPAYAGVLQAMPDRLDLAPDDDPDGVPGGVPDDPDDVQGGVVGGVVGGVPGAMLGAPNPDRVPGAVPGDISIQLLSDSDGLDAGALRRHTILLRLRADVCRRQAVADGSMTGAVTATISLSASPRGVRSVHASDAGPLADCLERFYVTGDLPAGATLTFQLTIPGP